MEQHKRKSIKNDRQYLTRQQRADAYMFAAMNARGKEPFLCNLLATYLGFFHEEISDAIIAGDIRSVLDVFPEFAMFCPPKEFLRKWASTNCPWTASWFGSDNRARQICALLCYEMVKKK